MSKEWLPLCIDLLYLLRGRIEHTELECRLGKIDSTTGHFTSGIMKVEFDALYNSVSNQGGFDERKDEWEECITDYYEDNHHRNIRKTDNSDQFQFVQRIKNIDCSTTTNIDLRYSLKTETPIECDISALKHKMTRNKKRSSFDYPEYGFRIDFTIATHSQSDNESLNIYEVELELINAQLMRPENFYKMSMKLLPIKDIESNDVLYAGLNH